MKGTLTIIETDGQTRTVPVDRPPDFRVLQNHVHGMIETIPYFDTYEGEPCIAFCNEDGKSLGMGANPKATTAWFKASGELFHNDTLAGLVVIVRGDKALLRNL